MRLPTKGSGPAAMIIALIALLIAISGSSYAAVMVSRGSVDTDALRSGAVTPSKLAPEAVTATRLADDSVIRSKIHDGAVTSAKVKNRSLRAIDFAKGELPTGDGAQGPRGEQGAQGPQGVAGPKGEKGEKGEPGSSGSGSGSAYTLYDFAAPNSIAIPILVINTPQIFSSNAFTKQGTGPDFLDDNTTGMRFTQAGTYRVSYGLSVQVPLALVGISAFASKGTTGTPSDTLVPGSQITETYSESILAPKNIQKSFLVTVAAGEIVTTYVQSNLLGAVRVSQWVDVQKVS